MTSSRGTRREDTSRNRAMTQAKDARASKGVSGAHVPLLGTFRAFWPITDQTVPPIELIRQATEDLPWLTSQAHAVLAGEGRWSIAPSCKVPGSGRVTETVLLFEADAIEGRNPFADSGNEGAA